MTTMKTDKCIATTTNLMIQFTEFSKDLRAGFYVPVKSKLQHPPPGHLNFWKIFVEIPPHQAERLFKCPTPGKIFRLLF